MLLRSARALKLVLPKEHGSWAVLIAPAAAGFAAAAGGSAAIIFLFSCAALGAFLLRPALQALISTKREPAAWASGLFYGLLSLCGVVPLLFFFGRWWLVGLAAPAGGLLAIELFVRRGKPSFSIASELSGIAVLCLSAPAAYYSARGALEADAWFVWMLSALYFSGPVFHVKMAALQHRASSARALTGEFARMRRRSLAYHFVALIAVVAAAAYSLVPVPTPLPFAISLAKTWRRGELPPAKVDFRRLGYQEVGYSVVFAIVLVLGYLARGGTCSGVSSSRFS